MFLEKGVTSPLSKEGGIRAEDWGGAVSLLQIPEAMGWFLPSHGLTLKTEV